MNDQGFDDHGIVLLINIRKQGVSIRVHERLEYLSACSGG
jgi:hypothetical protein